MTDNNLQHHGVKGMKWGVRRDRRHAENRALREQSKRVGKAVRARKEKEADQWLKDYSKTVRKGMAIEKKKYKDIDAMQINRGKKAVKKLKVFMDHTYDHDRAIRAADKNLRAKRKADKGKKREETFALEKKVDAKFRKLYNQKVKGKPFFEGMKNYFEIDHQTTLELNQGYLDLDEKYGRRG